MATSARYNDVPVTLDTGEQWIFDFEIGDNDEVGQFARITSGDFEFLIDEDLQYILGDMPKQWRQPAIAKLLLILDTEHHRDGHLN
ncbi:hypothetical protein [Sphingobacterium thalpophilum]|uniref:hypothetical protein n=1 Tax=Sphingobacterium thalpophilum TaxID=259 RepID=UPI003D97CAEC